ncbi:MAG: type III-B CRISPR module RAMP protein Cmr4 [Desulfitobacteriaceae bacterium]|nr:type III-B CRISPR module RAMP protein Cmr4 [Desulfitobacteriaceae bacterium]
MFSNNGLLFLQAVTSIHAGSGSELGLVDLPIQREKHTDYPKIESSSLKGAIRATVKATVEATVEKATQASRLQIVFGKESAENQSDAQAGAISFSDARLLLFPVKSLRGVFAWVTCPLVLKRFNEELKLYRQESNLLTIPSGEGACVSSNTLIVNPRTDRKQVVLEEYTYSVQLTNECQELASQLAALVFEGIDNGFSDRLMVLPDDDFVDFVTLSTEVNARIRINPDTGTVKGTALWYEENVPPETVFYSYCFAGNSRITNQEMMKADEVLSFIKQADVFPACFQLGGNSSLGKGILRRIWR